MEQQSENPSVEVNFVKSLFSHLARRTPEIYTLKKSLGKDLKEDMYAYMAFKRIVANIPVKKEDEELYFLYACLFFNTEKPFLGSGDNIRYVKFEELLSKLYGTTDSTKAKIRHFLSSDTGDGFNTELQRFVIRCKKGLRANERIDHVSLLKDIRHWDDEERTVRAKWVNKITRGDRK